MVQWLGLRASTAGATGSIPGWKRKRERETSCFVYSKENDRVSVSTSNSQEFYSVLVGAFLSWIQGP